jgi:hypothetical protein
MAEAAKEVDDATSHAALVYERCVWVVSVDEISNAICRLIERHITPSGSGQRARVSTAPERNNRLIVAKSSDINAEDERLEMIRLHLSHLGKSNGFKRDELGCGGIGELPENPDAEEVGIFPPLLRPAGDQLLV